MCVVSKQSETKEKKMITYAEAQTHARFVRDVIIRHGDLRAALGTMDESEKASVIKSLKMLDRYNLQEKKQIITYPEVLAHARFIRNVIIRNGDLRAALGTMDEAEAEAVYKSLNVIKRYKMQQLEKQKEQVKE